MEKNEDSPPPVNYAFELTKENSVYYRDNEDFLLRFGWNEKKKYLLFQCLNTKKISDKNETFSNSFTARDLHINLDEIKENLFTYFAMLLVKHPPTGKFHDEKFELIFFNGENQVCLPLIRTKFFGSSREMFEVNVDKKIKQLQKKLEKKYNEYISEKEKLAKKNEELQNDLESIKKNNEKLIEENQFIVTELNRLQNLQTQAVGQLEMLQD